MSGRRWWGMEGRWGVEENQGFSSIRGRIRALCVQWIGGAALLRVRAERG